MIEVETDFDQDPKFRFVKNEIHWLKSSWYIFFLKLKFRLKKF